jgi:hypothetical protein
MVALVFNGGAAASALASVWPSAGSRAGVAMGRGWRDHGRQVWADTAVFAARMRAVAAMNFFG